MYPRALIFLGVIFFVVVAAIRTFESGGNGGSGRAIIDTGKLTIGNNFSKHRKADIILANTRSHGGKIILCHDAKRTRCQHLMIRPHSQYHLVFNDPDVREWSKWYVYWSDRTDYAATATPLTRSAIKHEIWLDSATPEIREAWANRRRFAI